MFLYRLFRLAENLALLLFSRALCLMQHSVAEAYRGGNQRMSRHQECQLLVTVQTNSHIRNTLLCLQSSPRVFVLLSMLRPLAMCWHGKLVSGCAWFQKTRRSATRIDFTPTGQCGVWKIILYIWFSHFTLTETSVLELCPVVVFQ